jgi:DNA-binding response OmpR family regulator
MRLLIVEDDALLGAGLRSALGKAGFDVSLVRSGEAALETLSKEFFLAMVLDIGLPGMSGLDVLSALRSEGNRMPVLILTARETTPDKVLCFDTGADDFLAKTTDIEELIARLRALIRRSGRGGHFNVAGLTLDVDNHTVTQNGRPVNLSKREFELLRVLLEGVGKVITRSQLERTLYGSTNQQESNSIEVHIHNLRSKIGSQTLKTVRGVGYTINRNEH